jgi:hypothetical protein
MEKSITIDIENSNRDDDVTVITNLSSVEASYTVVQGKAPASLRSKLIRSPRASNPLPERTSKHPKHSSALCLTQMSTANPLYQKTALGGGTIK